MCKRNYSQKRRLPETEVAFFVRSLVELKSFIHLQRATSFTADPHEEITTRNRFGVLHAISTGKHPGKLQRS